MLSDDFVTLDCPIVFCLLRSGPLARLDSAVLMIAMTRFTLVGGPIELGRLSSFAMLRVSLGRRGHPAF